MFSPRQYLYLTLFVSAVVIAVAMIAGVEWWLGVGIFLVVVLVGLLVTQHVENKRLYERQPQPTYQPPPPPQPTPPANMTVKGLVLPSAQRDYRFRLDLTVLWQPQNAQGGVAHPRPDQLAVDAIRDRAAMFAERESPADADVVAPKLATELSFPRPDRTGQLEVWAQGISLTLPDDDRVRLHKLAQIRKDEEVWEYERAYERNKRTYLRDDVLSSTGSAVVWWLAHDSTRIPETVDLIGTFAKLVAAAHDREVEPVISDFVNNLTTPPAEGGQDDADVVDRVLADLVPGGTENERALAAFGLADLAAELGRTDLAQTIRERFNAPKFTATEPSPPDAPEPDPTPEPSPYPNGQPAAGASDTPPGTPYVP